MPSSPTKIYQIGKELIEARNMGEALGVLREMKNAGKVSRTATVVEHGIKNPELGEVAVKEFPKENFGKVKVVPAVAAMPAVDPLSALQNLNQQYQQNIVQPIAGAMKSVLTPDLQVQGQSFPTSNVVSNTIIDAASDPINYVPGPAGAIAGAAEMVGGYADGGEVIPDEQVTMMQPSMGTQVPTMGMDIPDDAVELDEDKYGSTGQMAITALEGAAHGVAGPLATLAEKHLLGVKEGDILARQRENPIAYGAGQAAGFAGSALTGAGLGSIAAKGAAKTAQALGLGTVEGASLGFRVGSSAVKEAAEMAILSSADEVSKMILNDPDTSAESALGHIGLGAALGGAGGALITGVAGPLWNATAGPQVEKLLGSIRGHLDGSVRTVLPEDVDLATKTLGVELDPMMKAALGGDERAVESFTTLKYAQNPQVMKGIEKLQNDVSESVMNSLGVPLKDAQVYSKNEAGHDLEKAFKKEYDAKYAPVEKAMEKRNREAATIGITDDARLAKYGQLIEKGMKEVGTDSPMYKLFDNWGERLLAKETVGGIDQLKTELRNDIEMAMRAADYNKAHALKTIRNELDDFQEAQIARLAKTNAEGMLGSGGRGNIGDDVALLAEHEEGKNLGASLLNERAEANRTYKDFAGMSNELLDHIGAGNFKGAGTLLKKIESVGAEGLLNKFSVKNNADFIPFLAKNFPETLAHVRQNELKQLIQPAINRAKGENPVDVKALSDILKKTMAGKKELADFALSPEALSKIEAAERILSAIPQTRDSGTPGGLAKLFSKMPQSAMAAIGMIAGGNPVAGYLAGEMSQRLGRDIPDAMRLSYLKFLGSDQPIKAEGFKAMADFVHATMKGENRINKSIKAVFKAGAQVIADNQYPSDKDNERLDKKVTDYQKAPDQMFALTQGAVGHYMPHQQASLAMSATKAIQYLQSIKPQPHKIGPLDKEVPPQPAEIARYNRALSIANNPSIVLERVKDGTLQVSDIRDLGSMYPALYKQMSQKLINEMTSASADDETIPYKTRIGTSLFLGAPVDASMSPQAIMAAQPKPSPLGQQQAGDPGGNGTRKGAASKLGKTNSSYLTQSQSAEVDRSSRK